MNKVLKIILSIHFCAFSAVNAQETASTDSLRSVEGKVVAVYTDAYMAQYNRLKRLILKVYPYALYAADVLDELENDAASIEKRRKKNKFYKDAYKDLKEDFKYVFLDMYQIEGQMLMKLVHRETGLTVYEIAENYRGKKNAEIFSLMGKVWSQDLKAEFDPEGKDKIAEHVISDIEKGIIKFNTEVDLVTKNEYKEGMKEYRENKRTNRKHKREQKRKERSSDSND